MIRFDSLTTHSHSIGIVLGEVQSKFQLSKEAEKATKDECITLRSKLSTLESQLNASMHENELSKMEIEKKETECMLKQHEFKRC